MCACMCVHACVCVRVEEQRMCTEGYTVVYAALPHFMQGYPHTVLSTGMDYSDCNAFTSNDSDASSVVLHSRHPLLLGGEEQVELLAVVVHAEKEDAPCVSLDNTVGRRKKGVIAGEGREGGCECYEGEGGCECWGREGRYEC